jgi:hypothetical protein
MEVPLSEVGREQAKVAGQGLDMSEFDYVFCSDLKRCRETLEIVMQASLKTEKVDSDLPELVSKLDEKEIRKFVSSEPIVKKSKKKNMGDSFTPDISKFLFWKIIKVSLNKLFILNMMVIKQGKFNFTSKTQRNLFFVNFPRKRRRGV